MQRVATASTRIPGLASLHLDESIRQFGAPLKEQLDLSHEAENLERFNFNFRRWRSVSFPKPGECKGCQPPVAALSNRYHRSSSQPEWSVPGHCPCTCFCSRLSAFEINRVQDSCIPARLQAAGMHLLRPSMQELSTHEDQDEHGTLVCEQFQNVSAVHAIPDSTDAIPSHAKRYCCTFSSHVVVAMRSDTCNAAYQQRVCHPLMKSFMCSA